MVRIPRHRAKDSATRTGLARRRLALVEEAMTQAEPAKLGQQHGLAEIEAARDIDAGCHQRRDQAVGLAGQRRCGGDADRFLADPRPHQSRLVARQKCAQIRLLMRGIALVKIGPLTEDADAQRRQRLKSLRIAGHAVDDDRRLGHSAIS